MARIILEDVKIYAYHGVLEEETLTGTYYLLTLELHADIEKAVASDSLEDTINYAIVNDIVHEEMKIPSKLLEHVCGRILNKIHLEFPQVEFMKIKLTKTSPPMRGEMRGVSVEIERSY
ncbi:dihydroneopterin aldolase [Chryseobacterium sp. A301]